MDDLPAAAASISSAFFLRSRPLTGFPPLMKSYNSVIPDFTEEIPLVFIGRFIRMWIMQEKVGVEGRTNGVEHTRRLS